MEDDHLGTAILYVLMNPVWAWLAEQATTIDGQASMFISAQQTG